MSKINPKYRILHINTRFIGVGASGAILNIINGLPQNKFQIDLAFGSNSDFHVNIESKIHTGINIYNFSYLIRNLNPLKDIIALFEIYKLIKYQKYDIVHTHTAKAGFIGRIAAKLAKTPIIIHHLRGTTFHESQPYFLQKFYIFLERIASKCCNHIISVGDDLKIKYLKNNIGTEDKYSIIRSGISLDFFKEYNKHNTTNYSIRSEFGISQDDFLILKVATLEPRKGHFYTIEIAEKIIKKFPNAKFLFVGDGQLYEDLIELIKKKNLEGNVILAGYRNDVYKIMNTSDVLIHTSLWEGLPQVFVQAAAIGLPIISFNVEGANELIRDGFNGYITPIKDINLFEHKLSNLLSNPKHMQTMGEHSPSMIDDSWEDKIILKKIENLYDNLLTSHYKNTK